MTTAYRDDLAATRLRRDELIRVRGSAVKLAARGIAALTARRKARAWAGAIAVGGWLTMAVAALLSRTNADARQTDGLLTSLLLGSWPVALATWLLVRLLAGRGVRARMESWAVPSADAAADVARLEGDSPLPRAREDADELEVASIAWPMVGAALLLPLTLHFAVGFEQRERFDRWILTSLAFVGHAHVVFAGLCWLYARRLRRAEVLTARRAVFDGYMALALTAASSIFPTVIFAPLLVLATGVLPVPVMFVLARRVADRERAELRGAELASPAPAARPLRPEPAFPDV